MFQMKIEERCLWIVVKRHNVKCAWLFVFDGGFIFHQNHEMKHSSMLLPVPRPIHVLGIEWKKTFGASFD